jgi:hypothetical protein
MVQCKFRKSYGGNIFNFDVFQSTFFQGVTDVALDAGGNFQNGRGLSVGCPLFVIRLGLFFMTFWRG